MVSGGERWQRRRMAARAMQQKTAPTMARPTIAEGVRAGGGGVLVPVSVLRRTCWGEARGCISGSQVEELLSRGVRDRLDTRPRAFAGNDEINLLGDRRESRER